MSANRRLFIAVTGHRNSGKSHTWNSLFGQTVRTGKEARNLALYDGKSAEVFLVSGSPEERKLYVGDILNDTDCRIMLCSVQYTEKGLETLNFALDHNFDIYLQWLNPGYSDGSNYYDSLGWIPYLSARNAIISLRDGKANSSNRVEEIRSHIYGWASRFGLTF